MFIYKEDRRKRLQGYVLGLVVILALAGCSSHRHHGMAGEGNGEIGRAHV